MKIIKWQTMFLEEEAIQEFSVIDFYYQTYEVMPCLVTSIVESLEIGFSLLSMVVSSWTC